MNIVKLEKVILNLSTSETTKTASLTGFTSLAQIVPFTASASLGGDTQLSQDGNFDVEILAGPSVKVSRVASAVSAIVVVYVIELAADVLVQKGTFDFTTSDTSKNVSLSALTLANSFCWHFVKTTDGSLKAPRQVNLSSRLSTTTNIAFNVNTSGVAQSGHWYTISHNTLTVQRGVTPSDASPANITLSSIDTAKSFLVLSDTTIEDQYEDEGNSAGRITTSTNLEVSTGYTSGSHTYYWQVITDSSLLVQRGAVVRNTGSSGDLNLGTAVDLNRTVAHAGHMMAHNNSSEYNKAWDVSCRSTRYDLVSNTKITWSKESHNGSAYAEAIQFNLVLPYVKPTIDSISSPSENEGTGLVFGVSLTHATQGVETYTISMNTFSSGFDSEDYAGFSFSNGVTESPVGTLNVPDGVTTFSITLGINQDVIQETNETFRLNIDSTYGTGTVINDDIEPITTAFADGDIFNNESNLMVTGTTFDAAQGKIWLGNKNTYAEASSSGILVEQTVNTWNDTEINIRCIQDTLSLGTVYLYVETAAGRIGGSGYSTSIIAAYVKPTVSTVSNDSNLENLNLVHLVTLSHATEATETYLMSLTHNETTGSDIGTVSYSNGVTLSLDTLSVPSGVSSFSVIVQVVDDTIPEPTETYTLIIGGVTATGTITDNDSGLDYKQTIQALGPNHLYTFDGVYTDDYGTAHGTNTGCVATGPALCSGVTKSIFSSSTADTVDLGKVTTVSNSDQTQRVIAGWFKTSKIQQPPCRVYGEGGVTNSLAFILGFGNNILFELDCDAVTLQIYGDVSLVQDRIYHLTLKFDGSGGNNEFSAFIDGVKQLESANVVPNIITLPARSPAAFGKSGANVALGGTQILLVASVNGYYNNWCMWHNSLITDQDIKLKLFEKGVLSDISVTSQSDLDDIAGTHRANAPCCISLTGTNLDLVADNVTFDTLSTIHIQWLGSGTLNWTNLNGSNATKISNLGGGLINLINPYVLELTNLQANSEIRVYKHNTSIEIAGQENTTGTFSTSIEGQIVDIKVVSVKYKNIFFKALDIDKNTSIKVEQFYDRNYKNE